MKKKIILIIMFLLIILTGCGKKLDKKIFEKQKNVIKNIGVSKDGYYVYNKDNKYYIYFVSDTNYTCYLYILHESEKEYNEYKDKYKGDINANISSNDEAYLTIITIDSGTVNDDFESSIAASHKGYKLVK